MSFIQAVSKITDEIKLRIDPEKIWFRGMDSAHVSMIDFEIPKSYFSDYEVENEEIINILLEKVTKFLKGVKKNETIELTLDKEGGKLVVRIISGYTREFAVPLLDVGETSPLGLPKVEFPVMYRISASALQEALKNVKQISDKVKLIATMDELKIKGESDEGYETAISLKYGGVEVIEREIKDESKLPATSTYNIDIMSGVVKELYRISDSVALSFGTDLPLKLSFDIPGELKFDFYLAPRIE